jgi:NAD(P)-dependent dehydrogenase (short-subunit alcohol dehydrogenase family)
MSQIREEYRAGAQVAGTEVVVDDRTMTWLITGCSSGFGRAIAAAALGKGDNVVATARRVEALEDLVELAPRRVCALALDLTKPAEFKSVVGEAVERFGEINVLVNNAGFGSVGAVEEIAREDLATIMETMFLGPVALTQAVLPHMRSQGNGAIVQISSMGGQIAPAGFGAYCSAKAALEAMSVSLSHEVSDFGIRVLIVEPGAFRTEFGGARMNRSREIPAYATTVGLTRAALDEMDGTQPGDPRKAAAAVMSALASPSPPLRLALGNDAVDLIRGEHDRRRADLAAWEDISRSCDLDR